MSLAFTPNWIRSRGALLMRSLGIGLIVATSVVGGNYVSGQNSFDTPQTNLQPIGPPPGTNGPSTFQGSTSPAPSGSFNPYAANPQGYPSSATLGNAIPAAPNNGGLLNRLFSGTQTPFSTAAPLGSPAGYGLNDNVPPPANAGVYPPAYGAASTYGTPITNPPTYPPSYDLPSYGQTTLPPFTQSPPTTYGSAPLGVSPYGSPYPQSAPTTLFPSGLWNDSMNWDTATMSVYRLLQGPRFRYTYIGSGDSTAYDLGINDFDTSIVFAWQNFLYSSQPLMIAPSFSLHLWDGPESSTGADLPPNAYSAFLDLGWQSDPNQIFGMEVGTRFGVFTDFDTYTNDSFRIMGRVLGNFRLTPTSTLKAGAYYLDRNKIKLLPAGGLLWQPTPYSRWDIFFPQPKYSRYCRTVGTQDVWGYIAGEYGGGSWTIKRESGMNDSVDINDWRIMMGLEWGQHDYIRAGRRNSFIEIGYVFNRELVYRYNPNDDIDPDDAFMLRLGIGY
ncbi:hypothetical protein [Novipirellula aureliae]|nr:hypothetical protein [Novipirellula aureliae]